MYYLVAAAALCLALAPDTALAGCTTWVVMDGTRQVVCVQCCTGGNCQVSCN